MVGGVDGAVGVARGGMLTVLGAVTPVRGRVARTGVRRRRFRVAGVSGTFGRTSLRWICGRAGEGASGISLVRGFMILNVYRKDPGVTHHRGMIASEALCCVGPA